MATITTAAGILLEEAQEWDENAISQEMKFSVNYLTTFGYIAKFGWDNRDALVKAVKTFQKWWGNLKPDGIVGPKTLSAMQEPRCGFPDILDKERKDHKEARALVEFAKHNMNQWKNKGLKYYIKSYVSGLTRTEQQGAIAGAWGAWNDVCGIYVARTTSEKSADLIIDTGSGRRSNFDGAGGTLAWAYLPQGGSYNGKLLMRFDLGETWITDPNRRGILLFNVACHEFGHMLGLGHSKKQGALMAPYYNPRIAVPQWDDDIPRVEARYGKPTATPPSPTPTPPSGGGSETFNVTCKDLKVAGYTLFKG
jgi:hypothetical protein